MVLLESAWSGVLCDVSDSMAEKMEEYWSALCIDISGGMGGLGDCNDGSIS